MRGEVVGLRSKTSAGQTGASRPKRLRKSWVDRIEWVEPLSLGREDAARFLKLGQLGPAALLCKDRVVALTTGDWGSDWVYKGRIGAMNAQDGAQGPAAQRQGWPGNNKW